jgi:hypothetical protein
MDLSHGLQPDELTSLALLLDDVILHNEVPDTIIWRFAAFRKYSASLAYLLQFEGSIASDVAPFMWEGWPPVNAFFFLWTAAMNKI